MWYKGVKKPGRRTPSPCLEGSLVQISIREEKGYAVVAVGGRLDALTAPEFETRGVEWLLAGHIRLVMDFSSLEYVSSAGLRSVLVVLKKAKSVGGSVVLFGLSGVVKEVFAISGFDSLLPVAENEAAAALVAGA